MTTVKRLSVIWRAPGDGTKYVVGYLSGGPPYEFRFGAGLKSAEEARFPGFPEFSDQAATYVSEQLFATFRHRIPPKQRPDLKLLLKGWGADESTPPLELLGKSGGFLLTDRVELAEYRDPDDDLSHPLSFRVAGQSHHGDPDAKQAIGAAVDFRRQPDNVHDPDAVEVICAEIKLGYVPRQYAQIFSRLLTAGVRLVGRTERRLLVPGEPLRWVVQARNPAYDAKAPRAESHGGTGGQLAG